MILSTKILVMNQRQFEDGLQFFANAGVQNIEVIVWRRKDLRSISVRILWLKTVGILGLRAGRNEHCHTVCLPYKNTKHPSDNFGLHKHPVMFTGYIKT